MSIIHRVAGKVIGEALGTKATKEDVKLAKLQLKQARIEEKAQKEIVAEKKRATIKSSVEVILNYTVDNHDLVYSTINNLYDRCSSLKERIDSVAAAASAKIVGHELRAIKRDAKTAETEARTKFKYLYLAKDYLTYLTTFANGLGLSESQLMLIIKFAPFFSGVSVLENEENGDLNESESESLLTEFKSIGLDMASMFVPIRSNNLETKNFSFESYLEQFYERQLQRFELPDIAAVTTLFEKAVENYKHNQKSECPVGRQEESGNSDDLVCENCNMIINKGSKFCPNCGKEVSASRPKFCSECGASLNNSTKFCPNCGAKVLR